METERFKLLEDYWLFMLNEIDTLIEEKTHYSELLIFIRNEHETRFFELIEGNGNSDWLLDINKLERKLTSNKVSYQKLDEKKRNVLEQKIDWLQHHVWGFLNSEN